MHPEFDFIIVGGGSAGCVLANRLSADPRTRVLLLEAGTKDTNPLIKVPIMTRFLYTRPSLNWGYDTEPQLNLDQRKIHWPRGKVLGGSSSINGMVYIRGNPADFDEWKNDGCLGWSYEEVLPYFKKSECHYSLGEPYHGSQGPLSVGPVCEMSVIEESFLKACIASGIKRCDDFNAPPFAGTGFHDFTVAKGRRQSTSTSFLTVVAQRRNLTIKTNATVSRIIFENKRAIGLEYTQKGETFIVKTEKEVVLSAGTVNSPAILLRSGVGDATTLKGLELPVVTHLPNVGKNLQDHLGIYVSFECIEGAGLRKIMRPDRAALLVMRAMFFGTGLGTSLPLRCCTIIQSNKEIETPDIKMTMIPALVAEHPWKRSKVDGFAIHGYQLRPESRGQISLSSPSPNEKPLIDPNYLSSQKDRSTLRNTLRKIRTIADQSPLTELKKLELAPGGKNEDDDSLDDWIAQHATTAFHPVGTCKMGISNESVVGPNLSVHGLEGIRVIDASIMPNITSGNTNAPTIMIAEKGADLILGR